MRDLFCLTVREKEEIEQEYHKCFRAFEKNPDALSAWCCHHERLWELKQEPWGNRIDYIEDNKPEHELAVRFRNFRPCSQHEIVSRMWSDYMDILNRLWEDRTYNQQCVDRELESRMEFVQRAGQADNREFISEARRIYINHINKVWSIYEANRILVEDNYLANLKPFYIQDVPNGTWNGTSIFL